VKPISHGLIRVPITAKMLRVFKQYFPIRNIFFVIGEGIFIYVSVMVASYIIMGPESFYLQHWLMAKILLVTLVCQTCLYYNDLYDLRVTDTFTELGIRLLQALGIAAIFLAFIYILFPQCIIATGTFIVSICFVIFLIVSWRFCYSAILNHGLFDQKIILLGSSDLIKNIKREIEERKDCGYAVALELPDVYESYCSDKPLDPDLCIGHKYEGLEDVAVKLGVTRIVAGFKEKRNNFPTQALLKCRMEGIDVVDGHSFFEMLSGKLTVGQLNPSWLIFSSGFHKSRYRRFLKRFIDLILSFILLIVTLPVIVITALLIKIDSRGPVIFSQERVGEKHKIYWIHKFRSMVRQAEKHSGPVWTQNNDPRITRVGKFIRKWRIDEIPQLYNVFKGQMSLVGPRPEREFFVKDLQKQIPYYAERFHVKPGITGWAQICYPYGASAEDAVEKLNYDLFYIKNMSTLMDLSIVLRTIKIVLFGRGAR